MKKRILPALLALCMVMSLLPATVFAEKGDSSDTPTATKCDCKDTGCTNQKHSNAAQGTQCSQDVAEGKSKCEGCQSYADSKDDNKDDEGEDTPTPAAKCATCGCEVTADSDCKISGKFEAKETVCAHDGEDETAGTRDAECKYAVCTNMDCTKYGKNVLKTHDHEDVSAGNCSDGGKFNSKKANCAGSTHYAGCPKKCEVEACNKIKDHEDSHGGSVCTNDSRCPVGVDTAANVAAHKATCPVVANVEAGEGKEYYTYEKTYDVTDLTCACATEAHGHEAMCGKALEGTYSISVKVEIDEGLANDAAKKAAAETGAATNGINTAKEKALAAWKAEHTVDDKLLCADCVKAIANSENRACTGTVDCPIADDGAHKDDCLSLCTHNDSCGNSVGVPEAHQVWYRVEKVVAGGDNEVKGTYADRADAVALLNSLRAAAEEAESNDKYQLIAVHCPKAGVADSTVLGATDEGETTDPTDPEDKAPEKAEDFTDVAADAWYAEELTALMEKKVFVGNADKTFNPAGNVTGAELVVLLSRVAGEELVTTGAEWNKAATEWAAEAGYTEGLEVTTTGKLTRQDVILVLWRAAGKPESEQSLEDFADAEGLEGDYLSAMKWAVEKEIIKGDGDTGALKAETNITRAEMVAVLTRYDKAVNAK